MKCQAITSALRRFLAIAKNRRKAQPLSTIKYKQNMNNMELNNVRAIMKPKGYKADRELGLKEKLFGYDQSPMVAYGTDKGSHIEYEEAIDASDLELKLKEIKKIALLNNSKIIVSHSVQDIDGEKLFIVNPHEYAAEKILDKEFLKTVSKELNSESFLVGIPHQGIFAAVSSLSTIKGKFLGFIKQKFENPEAYPITPHVFEIFQGEIIAVAGEDAGGTMNTIEQKSNGDLIVELDSNNFDEFTKQVSQGYSQAMLLAMKNKDFSGNIIFNENNKSFEFDNTVLAKCKSFIEQINGNEMAQTVSKAISGNGIHPAFTHRGLRIDLEPSKEQSNDMIKEKAKNKKWWQFGK